MRRSMIVSGLAVSAALAASVAGFATAASPAGTKANPVKTTTSTSKGFGPKTVTVKAGATVYFHNVDHARHSAIQDAASGKPKFNSGAPTTKDFSLKAPTKTGTYSYICKVHGFMRGTLIVKK